MKQFIRSLLAVSFIPVLSVSGCTDKKEEPLAVTDLPVIHETEFGGVYITIGIDDFNKKGFAYGDSVDIEFSNGYTLEDIPYYNGYYVDAGQPLLIAYPGYDYIKAAINYGEDLWHKAGLQNVLTQTPTLWKSAALDEHSTASVRLNEAGKYKDIQEARDISYSDDRSEYPSDAVFANYRSFSPGQIKKNVLYRSATPCDSQHNRASYTDRLMQEAGVKCILNLCDTDEKIQKYIGQDDFDSPYFLTLYESENVIPIALNMNYLSEEFAQKIAEGFIALSEKEGPYLIHCTEGKDRTGFVCMLIEALAGASYTEIADDYMITYDNYYKINPEKDPKKYQTILESNLDAMLKYILHDVNADLHTADLTAAARSYLKYGGMSDDQIDRFLARMTE